MGAHGEGGDPSVGPKLPSILPAHGIELLSVTLFPVSVARTGAPPPAVWEGRREALRRALDRSAGDAAAADLGRAYAEALERYAHEAAAAGPGFVEIQNTMLFATVGQKKTPDSEFGCGFGISSEFGIRSAELVRTAECSIRNPDDARASRCSFLTAC